MTVRELIEQLETMPDNFIVKIGWNEERRSLNTIRNDGNVCYLEGKVEISDLLDVDAIL